MPSSGVPFRRSVHRSTITYVQLSIRPQASEGDSRLEQLIICCLYYHYWRIRQILLVPITEVLFTSRDRESGSLFADLASSEEFLGSHVLRISGNAGAAAGGKDVPNMRENRGKAKQFATINGRTVVVKDNFIYSNKGGL